MSFEDDDRRNMTLNPSRDELIVSLVILNTNLH